MCTTCDATGVMIPQEEIDAAVDRGSVRLDEKRSDWIFDEGLDLELLDMASSDMCVLGLLYGDYGDGMQDLGIQVGDGHLYGFSLRNARGESWVRLAEAWKVLITSRREAVKA